MISRTKNPKRERVSLQKMPSTDSVESGFLRDEALVRWLSSPADKSKGDNRSDPKSFFDLESWGFHVNALGISTQPGFTTSSPQSPDQERGGDERRLCCSDDPNGSVFDSLERSSLADAIMAPNVQRLSDSSIVEVHLRSFSESVSE
jgi:hypothetical protein